MSSSKKKIKPLISKGKDDFISNMITVVGQVVDKSGIIEYTRDLNIKKIFRLHSLSLLIVGSFLTFMPHGIMQLFMHNMEHMAHEIYRLYGVLNISIGYIVWKLRDIGDGRVGKLIAETFAVCYTLQAIVIMRAQFSNPKGHDLWHWILLLIYIAFAVMYFYLRCSNGGKRIKVFELPGGRDHND